MNTIKINIAGFVLELCSENEIELEVGYEPFLSDETPVDVRIECISGLPLNPFAAMKPVFVAENEAQTFYSIYRTGNQLGFLIYSQQNRTEIQQIAFLSEDFKRWTVYSQPSVSGALNPLRYPMGPIIMHYLTVNSDAVMIHASCVSDGQMGRIFTGFSGAGKSTISGIWADYGYQLINDDRLIIRRENNEYFVYNTPMYYADMPKKTKLWSINLISHSPKNRMRKLSGALAVSKVLAFCIQNNFDKSFIESNLAFISGLCSAIGVYELGFVPDRNVVDFVLENEAK